MQQYPAYLCGLRLEVLLARLVSLVSTSHFCACVCVEVGDVVNKRILDS